MMQNTSVCDISTSIYANFKICVRMKPQVNPGFFVLYILQALQKTYIYMYSNVHVHLLVN